MNFGTKHLKGSQSRDTFKYLHKQHMASNCYGCDIDFLIVSKNPPGIVAVYDYKAIWDSMTFAEVIAANDLSARWPFYVIQSERPEDGPFRVSAYVGGDWRPNPPEVHLREVMTCRDWSELHVWEQSLRKEYERRKQQHAAAMQGLRTGASL